MRGTQFLFYDGQCGTCHKFIRFLLRFRSRERFHFFPLSFLPHKLENKLDHAGRPIEGDSILLIRNGEAFQRSSAILAIVSELGFPWNLLGLFGLIPRFFRDAAYDLFAKHRFRFIGRVAPETICPLAGPDIRKLFPSKLPPSFTIFSKRRAFLTAQWSNLVFFNYVVPPELLLPHLPHGTELDLWEGKALCSLVAFDFRRTLVQGISIPLHKDFEEVNLRFYVKRKTLADGERELRRGVVFIKELVPKTAIAAIARVFYNENYNSTAMSHSVSGPAASPEFSYGWKAKAGECRFTVATQGEARLAEENSIDEFITEHYWGYAAQRDGGTVEYEVEHPKWQLWKAARHSVDGPLDAEYGKIFSAYFQNPLSVCVAEGSAVRVFVGGRMT